MNNDSPIQSFLEQLSSDSPTPGGGTASAACGAMGAALVQMVCRLTIGKKKYAEVEEQVKQILAQAEQLQIECTQLMEADAASFDKVMAAYRMPRDSEEEKAARKLPSKLP
jgi:formiminotetrahydrofolate cyclodeaminase